MLNSLVAEFINYSETENFRQGVYVEVTGMLIDIMLLVIFIPLIIWVIRWPQRYRIKRMATFFTLQMIRDAVILLLRIGDCSNPSDELSRELVKKRLTELFTHFLYGNTENLFQLLVIRFKDGSHISGYKNLKMSDLIVIKNELQKLANEIDQKIFLFNAVGLTSYGEKYMQAKITIQYLIDYFFRLKTGENGNSIATDNIRFLSMTSAEFFEKWFVIEKKSIDDAHNRKFKLEIVGSLFLFPYIFYCRVIKRKFCQFSSKPYFDPYASSFFSMMLQSIFSYNASNLSALSKASSISANLLIKYSNAHKIPEDADQSKILILGRALFPPNIWNDIVMENLSVDIRRRKHLLHWLDSVKAQATMWLVTLAYMHKDDKKIEKLFGQLLNLNMGNISYLNR